MKKIFIVVKKNIFFHENNSLKVQTYTRNDPCAWLWNVPIVNVMSPK